MSADDVAGRNWAEQAGRSCGGVAAASAPCCLQDLELRLSDCESRLAGVNNLTGRLMALDVMAAEMGVTVPCPSLTSVSSSLAIRPEQAAAQSAAAPAGSLPTTSITSAPPHFSIAATSPVTAAGSLGGGVITRTRQEQLQQQIEDGKDKTQQLQQHLHSLQQQVQKRLAGVAC